MPAEATCESVASLLPAMAGASDAAVVSLAATRHVSTCLACQAEVVRYRRVARSLRALHDHHVEVPAGLLEAVMAALDAVPSASGRARSRRLAYAGAVAAGAAATVVLVARTRRGRLPLAG